MSDGGTFVIVGASLAGAKAAETLRENGFDGRVVLVGQEDELPYERPPLSKGYLLGSEERDVIYVHDRDWYAAQGIELRLGTRVAAVHPGEHEVALAGGERLPYDRLLLATGSVVRTLSCPGSDLDGVRYLRSRPDCDLLRDELTEGRRVVVIGGGWIGMEVAAAARTRGCEVSLVDVDPVPLRRALGDEVGRAFADLHRDKGVDLHFGVGVREFGGTNSVSSVTLDDGTELAADLVVVGVGVRPATELAEAAGLTVEDGVVVDESLRTSDPDIYAAGDIAAAWNPALGRRIRVEHWANALNGGPAAARAMLGQQEVYDRLPYFFTDQYDLGMEYVGHAPPGEYDEVVFRGDVAGREYLAFWLRDRRVVAAMNVNIWDVTDEFQRIIRSGQQVDPARLADPSVALTALP